MFNGRYLVDIREYYTDDAGERKPGRKGGSAYNKRRIPHVTEKDSCLSLHQFILFLCAGIALSLDQWEKLKTAIPEIDAKIHGD